MRRDDESGAAERPTRTPEEIRASIEANRAELRLAAGELRSRLHPRGWLPEIRRYLKIRPDADVSLPSAEAVPSPDYALDDDEQLWTEDEVPAYGDDLIDDDPLWAPDEVEEAIDDKHIVVWLADDMDEAGLDVGVESTLLLRVGEAIQRSLVVGPATFVPARDVPEEGLATQWTLMSRDVELRPTDRRVAVERHDTDGTPWWIARFDLLIPHRGGSDTVAIGVTPCHASTAQIAISVDAHGERYRRGLSRVWGEMDKDTKRRPGDPNYEGDGRVPLASAELEYVGATRYVVGTHGDLPNLTEVSDDVFRWLAEQDMQLPASAEEALSEHLSAAPAPGDDDPGYLRDPDREPTQQELDALDLEIEAGARPEFVHTRIL